MARYHPSLAWIHRSGRSSPHIMAIRPYGNEFSAGKNTRGAMETCKNVWNGIRCRILLSSGQLETLRKEIIRSLEKNSGAVSGSGAKTAKWYTCILFQVLFLFWTDRSLSRRPCEYSEFTAHISQTINEHKSKGFLHHFPEVCSKGTPAKSWWILWNLYSLQLWVPAYVCVVNG